ncbi:transcription termination factor Rho [Wenjunlia tyrosinilytica]|uniref:Transcription termination factor Rho n=1 Tax=Wenjunlia tyrosinilytica TaxID=1544741 RepID=A0A918DVH3_9ACTN|nr:transcription termination factor Rho [Wenjunlia tyrosinilytica]GGO83820.1 hypothetical protein GCM10012280_13820 [Wenjunlia tyrosinilytica]
MTTTTQPTHHCGILDTVGKQGFLRSGGYLPSPCDPRVPAQVIHRHGLRRGDLLEGLANEPRPGARGERTPELAHVERINGLDPETVAGRPHFAGLTPLHPQERLRLETEQSRLDTRLIDIVSPIGKGQRGLLVAPPKTGKTVLLQGVAQALTRNHPECRLMVVLLDERPEEVTDMRRTVDAEVISSTFDRPAAEHTAVAELAVERAKRLVELGEDVVILLDSITRLCRAHNTIASGGGRTLSGGVDASAVHAPKRLFGAARNIENGGSLTILATALVQTGSRADDYFFEELKSTGNMELHLDRSLADRRVFPAVAVASSGTRKEELLTGPQELVAVRALRRVLSGREVQQSTELLLSRLRRTGDNNEFLRRVLQDQLPGAA